MGATAAPSLAVSPPAPCSAQPCANGGPYYYGPGPYAYAPRPLLLRPGLLLEPPSRLDGLWLAPAPRARLRLTQMFGAET